MGEDSIFFKAAGRNGSRKQVDIALVWEDEPKNASKRAAYISQLEEAGLEIEEDEDSESRGIGLRFTKLHVPMEVMKRYAEILKIRMKLKVGNQSYLVASKKGQICGLHRHITGGGWVSVGVAD